MPQTAPAPADDPLRSAAIREALERVRGTPLGDAEKPVVHVVRRALLEDLDRMVRHDAPTRRGDDIEDLHQMRVATRRLRTTLRTFRPLLDRDWSEGLRRDLAELAADLGAVRDLDVLLAQVRTDLEGLDDHDQGAGAEVVASLEARRAAARQVLLTLLDSPNHPDLVERLLEAAESPRCRRPDAPAAAALAPLVRRAWRRLRRAVEAGEDLHAVRLRVKRVRYATEAAEAAFGDPARRLSTAAAQAQDVLGIWADAVVAQATYRGLVEEVTPQGAWVLGRLAGMAAARQAGAAEAWPATWKALRAKRLRAFLRT